MAKTYTATLQIRCWKQHQCVGCDGSYAYEFIRKIIGKGGTAEKATAKAEAARKIALAQDTDLHPCPTCGLCQPDMIGQRRAKRTWVVFWCALLAFIACLILVSSYAFQSNVLTWAASAIGAISAGSLWMIALWNPNRDISANRARAAEGVAKGKLVHQSGRYSDDAEQLANPAKSPIQMVVLLLLIVAVGGVALPEITRTSRNWPLNPEAYPPVVGPGDQTRIYMQEKIDSIKSYWRGQAVAQLRDGDRTYKATAVTNQNDWGSTIQTKSSEEHSSSTPWVETTLPPEPGLAGKTIDCEIKLAVQYPWANGSGTYNTLDKIMQRSVSLILAPPGAGAAYMSQWWQYTLAGMGLILACSLVLVSSARALQRRAHPTAVFASPGDANR